MINFPQRFRNTAAVWAAVAFSDDDQGTSAKWRERKEAGRIAQGDRDSVRPEWRRSVQRALLLVISAVRFVEATFLFATAERICRI